MKKIFGIWVGVDERNTEYIIFQCETNLGKAKVLVYNSKKTIEKLKNAILKAIEWSDVAKKNSADGTKSLGCFGQDKWDLCEKEGTTFDKNQMGLRFFATNKGKQTNLIISLVDRDNQFIKTSIYLDLQKNEQLAQRS